nr:MAG TPA: hypothetical protein [Caudoviricetes sp.]DAP90026.1 MAG TPA: hypothetical protein [Caudoviricetes sp.]
MFLISLMYSSYVIGELAHSLLLSQLVKATY